MIRRDSNPGVHLGDGEPSKCTVHLRLVACHKLTGRRAKLERAIQRLLGLRYLARLTCAGKVGVTIVARFFIGLQHAGCRVFLNLEEACVIEGMPIKSARQMTIAEKEPSHDFDGLLSCLGSTNTRLPLGFPWSQDTCVGHACRHWWSLSLGEPEDSGDESKLHNASKQRLVWLNAI